MAKDWADAESAPIRTVGDLRRYLDQFGPAEKVFYTDGDRTYFINAQFCRVAGQDHPGKKWDEIAVMFSTI